MTEQLNGKRPFCCSSWLETSAVVTGKWRPGEYSGTKSSLKQLPLGGAHIAACESSCLKPFRVCLMSHLAPGDFTLILFWCADLDIPVKCVACVRLCTYRANAVSVHLAPKGSGVELRWPWQSALPYSHNSFLGSLFGGEEGAVSGDSPKAADPSARVKPDDGCLKYSETRQLKFAFSISYWRQVVLLGCLMSSHHMLELQGLGCVGNGKGWAVGFVFLSCRPNGTGNWQRGAPGLPAVSSFTGDF